MKAFGHLDPRQPRHKTLWGGTVWHLGPNCLLNTLALVPKYPDSVDPSNQC